jgi:hypothetical protein
VTLQFREVFERFVKIARALTDNGKRATWSSSRQHVDREAGFLTLTLAIGANAVVFGVLSWWCGRAATRSNLPRP